MISLKICIRMTVDFETQTIKKITCMLTYISEEKSLMFDVQEAIFLANVSRTTTSA